MKVPSIYLFLGEVLLHIGVVLQSISFFWRRKRQISGKIFSFWLKIIPPRHLFCPKSISFDKLLILRRRDGIYSFCWVFLIFFDCFFVLFILFHNKYCCCWIKLMIELSNLFLTDFFCFISQEMRRKLFLRTQSWNIFWLENINITMFPLWLALKEGEIASYRFPKLFRILFEDWVVFCFFMWILLWR